MDTKCKTDAVKWTDRDYLGAYCSMEVVYRDGNKIRGYAIEELAAFEEAEAGGRLIILPVKIGDSVWIRYSSDGKIIPAKISMLMQKANSEWKIRLSHNGYVSDHAIDDIGKTIFLSKEDAESVK